MRLWLYDKHLFLIMANRVSVGKYSNGNVTGRTLVGGQVVDNDKFGVYISKPGVDVDSAQIDELVFNTDTGISTNRVIGMFQLANATTTQGTDTTSTTVTSGSTATVSVPTNDFNFGFGFIGFGLFTGTGQTSGTGTNFESTISYTSNANNTISIQNTGTTNETVELFILPKFSNVAFF